MNIGLYFLIFIAKVIENGVATLRLIFVANGKKIIGAILQFTTALIWVLSTGIVVTNITSDPIKVIFFALGSLVGSYVGSIIEEKIALGDILINCVTNDKSLTNNIEKKGYPVYTIFDNKKETNILLFIIPRRKKEDIVRLIKRYDKDAFIFSEKVKDFSNLIN